jgi:hypothetical protein
MVLENSQILADWNQNQSDFINKNHHQVAIKGQIPSITIQGVVKFFSQVTRAT